MTTPQNVNLDSLSVIVDEVTMSMLGQGTTRDRGGGVLSLGDGWTGRVQIGAPTQVVVSVQCRRELALFAAERMLGGEQASDASARDVLGELTSMISGNMKSLLGDLSSAPLGSPQVTDGAVVDPAAWIEVHLRCGPEPMVIRVFRPEAGGA